MPSSRRLFAKSSRVCARNLSAGGFSCIHGGYLHPGSECQVVLPRREGGDPVAVNGTIVHCRHVEGSYHEVGIRFTEEIEPADLVPQLIPDDDQPVDLTQEMPSLQRIRLPNYSHLMITVVVTRNTRQMKIRSRCTHIIR